MDKLDAKIIGALNENARKSFRKVSRDLGVSLSTVANRVKRLEENGVITSYIPLIDVQKIGYDLLAIINIRISHGKLIEAQEMIAKDPHVYSVYDITGEWDSMVIARFKNRATLNTFLKRVLTIKNVERTNSHLVLNIVKDEKRIVF